jgi:choline-sulfatase
VAGSSPRTEKRGVTRGELLKGAAGVALLGSASAAAGAQAQSQPRRGAADRSVAGMNVLVFITDQQRAVQHFPLGWSERNMPGLSRLQRNGLTFQNAFTNACM